jgi:2-dehydro-3-deoxygluconokinase
VAALGADARPHLLPLVESAEILFGNHRDISLLLGRELFGDGEERRREAAEAAFAAFPRLRIIASTARRATERRRQPHRRAHRQAAKGPRRPRSGGHRIVDRIGAGDAFAAGVLHGLRSGCDLETTAHYGLALACLKHSLPGDASPFGQDDIDAFLDGNFDVRR